MVRSYGAALKDLGRGDDREMGRWLNNRAENSPLQFRRRERAMLPFRRIQTLRKFASVHAMVHNHFPTEHHLQNRYIASRPAPPLSLSGAAFWCPDGGLWVNQTKTGSHLPDNAKIALFQTREVGDRSDSPDRFFSDSATDSSRWFPRGRAVICVGLQAIRFRRRRH